MKKIVLSLCLAASCLAPSYAQIYINSQTTAEKYKACDDFATNVLHDPWDMNQLTDINHYVTSDLTSIGNVSLSSGLFNFRTLASNAAAFYLFSPQVAEITVRVGGRFGQDLNFDATKSAKYRQLSFRMNTDTEDSGGFKLVFNRATEYVPNRTVSGFYPIKTGWHTYTVDLPTQLNISTSESSNTSPWGSAPITGFSILPTAANNANVSIDFIRMEDPTTCASATINYTATTINDDNLVNLYLDDDGNLSNGYYKKIAEITPAAGISSLAASLDALDTGKNFSVVGLLHSDYATMVRDDAWDMSESTDISLNSGFSSLQFSGGSLTGVATSNQPVLYLGIPSTKQINAGTFTKLSFKLSRTVSSAFLLNWSGTAGTNTIVIDPAVADADNDSIYQVDLAGQGAWSGTIREIVLLPVVNGIGASFSLDWISLRNNGYVRNLDAGSTAVSTGSIRLNQVPVVDILRPNDQGGELFKPWNSNPSNVVVTSNLRTDTDPANPSEKYTTFLPDVRAVEGIRGDIFKGTNIAGNDDPNFYYTFPNSADASLIDADQYKNFCVKMLLDRGFDLCLGSILKPVWLNNDETFTDTEASIAIYNRWSNTKWYEYCFDMTTVKPATAGLQRWNGIKKGLRLDPHEFHYDTCGASGSPVGNPISATFYVDYARLAKEVSSDNNKLPIVFSTVDTDDTVVTNTLYYSAANDGTGLQTIVNNLAKNTRVYIWDTSAVPEGKYYLYVGSNDGLNTNLKTSKLPVIVSRQTRTAAPPVLSVESPKNGDVVCDSLQLKGYSLLSDRVEKVSAIEVKINGTSELVFRPNDYNPNAVATYTPTIFDSSNAAYNFTIDSSGLPAGGNTIEIISYGSDGQSTSSGTIAVTKSGSGCTSFITDPAPTGAPVELSAPNSISTPSATPTPTPTPAASQLTTPSITKISVDKKSLLTMSVSNAGESGRSCTLTISAGASAKKLSTLSKSFTSTKTTATLSAAKFAINGKKLKSLVFKLTKSCSGLTGSVTSSAKSLSTKKLKGKVATAAAAVKLLNKSLKIS